MSSLSIFNIVIVIVIVIVIIIVIVHVTVIVVIVVVDTIRQNTIRFTHAAEPSTIM